MPDLRLPAVCDFSITNVCNAACDFCGFARDKTPIGPARYVDTDAYSRALPILYRRGIRYLTLQGGEQQAVPCIGGYKYLYLDWNLDIWRCEAWTEPLGSVLDLDRIPRPARTLQRLHGSAGNLSPSSSPRVVTGRIVV
jgi:hypothetical protein